MPAPRRIRPAPSPSGGSDPLDEGAGTQTATAAHGDEPVAVAGAGQLVDGLGDQEATGATQRMAQGDGAAVGVDAGHVRTQLARPGQHDGGEGLVDLEDVDVVDGEAGVLEQLAGGGDGAFEHQDGVTADEGG